MIRFLRALFLLLAVAAAHAAESPGDAKFEALITDEATAEISGFAASRRHPGVIWTHNDSGDRAVIHALSVHGQRLATLRVRGASNVDWEDIAIVERDGRSLILIADTGDNGGIRTDLAIYAVEEPAEVADGDAKLAWKMPFQWPDGARDCEAMAVDPDSGEILLVSKKRVPPELFALPAQPMGDAVVTARFLGLLAGVAQPDAEDLRRNPVYGRYRAQITAADIRPDGGQLAVLNYLRVMLYARAPGQSWADAVAQAPRTIDYPWLPQAEAIAYGADGRVLYVGSERVPTPLLRLPLPDAATPP